MGAENDIIIAVELASTAVRAIAGRKEPDGSMRVLEFVQEESPNTIRKGVIDNIDRTTQAISRVVSTLSNRLKHKVNCVYVGLGGQSLRAVQNRVLLQFDGRELISHKIIDKMRDTNSGVVYPNAEIKEVVAQEYTLGTRQVVDPVGTQADALEANFLNIIARSTLEENIRECVQRAGLEVADVFLSPICAADALLSFNEKRSGCALLDIGAETTTVCVYSNNILRHLCVIPLGGFNVTSDITSLKVEAEEAEQLKCKYGTAYRPDEEEDGENDREISLSFNRKEKESNLQEIVEARYEEIIVNVWHHISSFADSLLSGIVVTGGASRIPDLDKAFARLTGSNLNVRLCTSFPDNISIPASVTLGEPDRLSTICGLLLAGKDNCVGDAPKSPQGDLFETSEQAAQKKEEEEAQAQASEQEKASESKPSVLSRIWKSLEGLLSEPDDDRD